MLTLYAVMKGFEGEYAHIQENAVQSWRWAFPDEQFLFFGDDEAGVVDMARTYGATALAMERTEGGAPLLPDIVEQAAAFAREDVLLFVNADIILEPQFAQAARTVAGAFGQFLLTARRRCAAVDGPLDFTEDWHRRLVTSDRGWYDGRIDALDLFLYRGGWMGEVPQFGIGRMAWDNWIATKARQSRVPFVDASPFTRALHQDHARHDPDKEPEIEENRTLFRSLVKRAATLFDATHHLDEQGRVQKGAAYHT